jgi:outer membrane protein assembly factor BamD
MRKCLAIALTLSLWGCGKSVKVDAPSMTIDEPDRVLYEKALKLMEKHNYEVAQVTLQTLISTYQESDYFPKAKFAIGESYYRAGGRENLDSSEAAFKDFIIYFRDSDIADDAQMYVAMTHIKRIQSPDRDNTEARLAELELKELITSYPDSNLLEEAKQKLREVVEILAHGSFNVANQYLLRKNYKAAVNRYVEIEEKWPDFSKMDETLYNHAEALRLGKNAEASATFYAEVVSNFPMSPKAKPAKQHLIDMNVAAPEPNPLAFQRQTPSADKNLLSKTVGVFKSHPQVPITTSAASVEVEEAKEKKN